MRRILLFVAALPIVVSALVTAQAIPDRSGRIEGVVKDISGAVLPGVTVTVKCNALIEKERAAVTDGNGKYVLADLPPGECSMAVALPGFIGENWHGFVARASTTELSFSLRVGALSEAITVSSGRRQTDQISNTATVTAQSPVIDVSTASAYGNEFNTEAYDKIDDNAWTAVSDRPLSTFSIDVDTASYANVRRFLTHGRLPPKDAVRTEEMINYFTYNYPPPSGSSPFSVTTALGEAPWNSRHRLALVGLQARRLDAGQIPPRNLVFLIDVSGSMDSEDKLPLVKASLMLLARNLTARDRIAIVVYAGAAGVVLPSTAGNDTSRVLEALGRLEAGGSTNGAEGIQRAYKIARDHFIKGGINRVILATDGDFNVGVTSEGDLVRLIEQNRDQGVALSVLGFGMGNLKDATMEQLADRGNGNYSYIDTIGEAQKVLVQEAGGTLVTLAKDVKLQVEFNPRVVAAYRLIGYENRLLEDEDFNDDTKDAGELGAGHSVTALYELVPVGQKVDIAKVDSLKYQRTAQRSRAAALDEALTVKIRYKAPDAAESTLTSVAVLNRTTNREALGFPAAVTEFGMLLRDSEFKGHCSYESAIDLATRFKGADPHGHRAEFIRLLETARGLSRR